MLKLWVLSFVWEQIENVWDSVVLLSILTWSFTCNDALLERASSGCSWNCSSCIILISSFFQWITFYVFVPLFRGWMSGWNRTLGGWQRAAGWLWIQSASLESYSLRAWVKPAPLCLRFMFQLQKVLPALRASMHCSFTSMLQSVITLCI